MSHNIANDILSIIGSRINHNQQTNVGGGHQIEGFWGHPSATVDWCEPNYVFTHYIAEFFNTISSLAMVMCGLCGVYFHYNKYFEKRYLFSFASVAVVGIGSAAFHGTLLFTLQMLDELPMIYSALIMTYIMIEQHNMTPKYSPYLPIALIVHGLLVTALVASPALAPEYASPLLQFAMFHISFAVLETFLLTRAYQLYKKEKRNDEGRRLFERGITLWLTALGCWVLDYFGCDALWEGENGIRKQYLTWNLPIDWYHTGQTVTIAVPNPQFHSWWHICASTGLYMLSLFIAYNRVEFKGYTAKIEYRMKFLPVIAVDPESRVATRQKSTKKTSEAKALSAKDGRKEKAQVEFATIPNGPQTRSGRASRRVQ